MPDAPLVAQVLLLPSPAGLPESLTYLVPKSLAGVVAVGVPVLAPLAGRDHLGYVVSVGALPDDPETRRLKPIKAVPRPDPQFDETMLALLRWTAREYRCSLAEALPLAAPERHGAELQSLLTLNGWDGAIPPRVGLLTRQTLEALHRALTAEGGSLTRDRAEETVRFPNFREALRRAKSEGWVSEERVLLPPKVRARTFKAVRLADNPPENAGRLGPQQVKVLERLAAVAPGETLLQGELCAELSVGDATVNTLIKRGLLEASQVAVRRAPRGFGPERDFAPPLNPFQGAATDAIHGAMRRGDAESLLLFGVTGSGKTEVYLNAIERAREMGRTATLLVPEISLTAQVAAAVRRRLGERVAILHSALSDGERFDELERVRTGEADVVVGPRSALFAPLKDPALIILDEEHDGSYKQDSPAPRYHARQVAQERARLSRACVVLGSATPSVESFHAAQTGAYQLLELPERVRQRPLPSVEIVDLRGEMKARPGSVFGARLEDSIRQRLAANEQVILFLNRRGYSAFLLCRDCGHVPHCPNCDVSLTLHRQRAGFLLCHYCGHTRRVSHTCPMCMGSKVKQFGLGTQRVEETVREMFPDARVARLDRDAISTKDAHTRIISAVRDREIDILVGTQMVTKGFDFPGVTLVGVVTADVALNMPDFRAAERAFQLLTQVSGRAGRGDQPGEVILQTFKPEHASIQAASRHDYRGFYRDEIAAREELSYPPFGSLARLLSSHTDDRTAQSRIETAATLLRRPAEALNVGVLGPTSCPLSRLKDRYRHHLLLKARHRDSIRELLDRVWPEIRRQVGGVTVDVEPQDLL